MEIVSRLRHDDTTEDWYRQLEKLVWHYKNIEQQDVELHKIDANENIENVLKQVLYYMNENEME
jgi:thymidylate kinase